MRSTLTFIGLLIMALCLSACQNTPSTTYNAPICTPRAQDAGHCYGFAVPSDLGV
jgi:hypothetical protein